MLESLIILFGKCKTPTQRIWKLGKENIPFCDNYKHVRIIERLWTEQQSAARKSYFAVRNDLSNNTNPNTCCQIYIKTISFSIYIYLSLKTSDNPFRKLKINIDKDVRMYIGYLHYYCVLMGGGVHLISRLSGRNVRFLKMCFGKVFLPR